MATVTFQQSSPVTDGRIESFSSTSWANARSGLDFVTAFNGDQPAGGGFGDSLLGAIRPPGSFSNTRFFCSFNTASALAGKSITSAKLIIYAFLPNPNTPINNAKIVQWTKTGGSAVIDATSYPMVGLDCSSTFREIDVINATNVGLSVNLNATGLAQIKTSGTDPTRFAIISQDDYTNTVPSNQPNDILHVNTVYTGNPTFGVQLVVTYTTGPAPTFSSINPPSGPTIGGQIVSIAGSNFVSGATVTLGGVPCTSVVVALPTSISCVTGSHPAGLVGITITNPDTGSVTANNVYTYQGPPPPPPVSGAGSQLIYDFTRGLWYSMSYGHLQSIISVPVQGNPFILGLDTSGNVKNLFDEDAPGVVGATLPLGRGYLETEPVSFGNEKTQKTFTFIRVVVNDVTAISAFTPGVVVPWLAYVYIDNKTTPIPVSLQVNPLPYNRFPNGMLEGANAGELIGYINDPVTGGQMMGHNIRVAIYYPVGTPTNTPTSGMRGTPAVPLPLPWTVYQIDVSATKESQSRTEP